MTHPTDFRAELQALLDASLAAYYAGRGEGLDAAINRARAALLAAPQQPKVDLDDELRGIFYKHCDSSDDGPSWIEEAQFIAAGRELLARYGGQAAPPPLTPQQQHALAALDNLLLNCTDNTGEAITRRAILGGNQ